jgi:5-bromo-4-chloroindolyl phosphate hydrolysis protein
MGPGAIGAFGVFIPIIAMLIGAFVIFSRSEIGRAFARRLAGSGESSPELLAEVDGLRREVEVLRSELTEVQERLDFTERLIAQHHVERVGSGTVSEPTH